MTEAKKLDEVAYDELLEMASAGSKVMQSRAVEFAKKFGVEFEVRSSLQPQPPEQSRKKKRRAWKTLLFAASVWIGIRPKSRSTTSATSLELPGRIFSAIAAGNIIVDMIVQSVSEHGTTDISFTIHENDLEAATKLLTPVVKEVKAAGLIIDERRGKTERRRNRNAIAFRSSRADVRMLSAKAGLTFN